MSLQSRGATLLVAALLVVVSCLLFANGAAAATGPKRLWTNCLQGHGSGQCASPAGVATDPTTGDVYVADQTNNRIDEFTPWGEFVRAFGSGVVSGTDQAEICEGSTPCRQGVSSTVSGGLNSPQAIAVAPSGAVYVFDRFNHRIEKFDATGHFVLMFGGEVDKTTHANVCTAASGDECGAGVIGTAHGFFTDTWVQGVLANIAIGQGEDVLLGEAGRIQEFEPDGALAEVIEGPAMVGGRIQALAVDSNPASPSVGDLYVAFESDELNVGDKSNVVKLSPSGQTLSTLPVPNPRALATDQSGRVYVLTAPAGPQGEGLEATVLFFGDNGIQGGEELRDSISASSVGLAADTVTESGETALYIANVSVPGKASESASVRAYVPAPDKPLPFTQPPSVPPSIGEQYATSVATTGAVLRASINPRYFRDTTLYLEYGLGRCSEGGCSAEPPAPGFLLTSQVVAEPIQSQSIQLSGLLPGTTYHYRFVATSSGGRTVGLEGDEGVGGEGTFKTYPLSAAGASCPNEAFRTGPGSRLPDCRAYEMVSPIEKEGGDIAALEGGSRRGLLNAANYNIAFPARVDQAAESGEALTYSARRAFGERESAWWSSQYLSRRDPQEGWSTVSIDPPVGEELLNTESNSETPFRGFDGNLCSAWFVQETDLTLVGGAPPGVPGLYRRRLCGGGPYELLSSTAPPGFSPERQGILSNYKLEVQGMADGAAHSFIRANAQLTPDAVPNPSEDTSDNIHQLYETSEGVGDLAGLRLLSVKPDGRASSSNSSIGSKGSDREFHGDAVETAVAANGRRVFWSSPSEGSESAVLYLRVNPLSSESARSLGAASGTGNLIGPVSGTGNLTEGSKKITEATSTSPHGPFAVGQALTGPGIPAGATIVSIAKSTLTISAAATVSAKGSELTGAASSIVRATSVQTGAFAVGQTIAGEGIPYGTTILAVNEVGHELTLSTQATNTREAVAIEASGRCSEAAKACTIQISEPGTFFKAASPEGTNVIYQTGEDLFEASIEESGGALVSHPTLIAEGVIGVMGVSADTRRIYFTSTDALAGGTQGMPNLFFYERGAPLKLIGTLAKSDSWPGEALPAEFQNVTNRKPGWHLSRVSADGLHAAFMSSAPLTGYDNRDLSTGVSDSEVFIYDAEAGGSLHCVSCDPGGARPTGPLFTNASGSVQLGRASQIPAWENQLHDAPVLSESGSYLFFESYDQLLPADVNHTKDVYEWETATNAHQCVEKGATLYVADAGGCLSLISSGESEQESELIDVADGGRDVFFTTASSLVPEDPGLVDMYDARIGGGFPASATPRPCQEACQPSLASPLATSPQSNRSGPGNPAKVACPKGTRKVSKHGATHCEKHKKHRKKRPGKKRARKKKADKNKATPGKSAKSKQRSES